MKRTVQLYIAGRRVDLGDDSWILYNWVREDMANPTALVNSSSHQVQLPGTCRNNSVFGSVFRLDRKTLFGVRYDGTQFDPTRKTPFSLFANDGTVLESGYCRLDKVDTHSRRHAYTVTLYGGLGSFFYSLAYKDDGTPKTLRDLIYKNTQDADVTNFAVTPVASDTVKDAWDYLSESAPVEHFWNIVNFAPAYNGLPDDFDASHALMNEDAYANIPAGLDEDGQRGYEYSYKAGLDCALVNFSNAHTEWELGDLRWYLQRPAISVKAFIAAICDSRNNGGYTVTLDTAFFTDDNPYYAQAWWTLPMIATEDRTSQDCLNNVLAATKSPMDYLTAFAKVFGLLFLWDSGKRSVRIVTRPTFYGTGEDTIDLSKRIDRSQEISQTPVLAEHKWYQLGDGGKGEFVEQYKDGYGKGYGVQRIDTGYEFDAETKILTEGIVFKDAAEVAESSLMYGAAEKVVNGRAWVRYFQLPKWEPVTVELWSDEGESRTFDLQCDQDTTYWDDPDYPGTDWLPKLQLHQADNKGFDGSDVLVLFAGMADTPVYASGSWNVHKGYYLTEDNGAMTALAGGPCWDLTRTGIYVGSLPSFRRVLVAGRYITNSFEWGLPAVRAVPGVENPVGGAASIYDLYWKAYLTDRFSADTRVMKCMVDLRGLAVGQALLRRFYWYDNAIWSLNAIRNHSLTSWDLTECEFVKVQDRVAYTNTPAQPGRKYLGISPASASFAFLPAGETQAIRVVSSSAWSLTTSGSAAWISFNRTSGTTGSTTLEVTLTANTGSTRRSINVVLTNTDGNTVTFNVSQAPMEGNNISLTPSSITISAAGTAIPGQASRGRSSLVTASGAWAVDMSTVPAWLTISTSATGISVRAGSNAGDERSASIKVYLTGDVNTWATLAVTQEAGEGGDGGITLLDGNGNNNATAVAAGQTITLYIAGTEGDGWTITNNASFASVSAASGTGDGSITVTVPANTGSQRSGTIVATRSGYSVGAIFYLYQAAPQAVETYIELTRRENGLENNVQITAAAQGEGFDVRSNGAWTCATSTPWLHVYGTAWSGSGNKTRWFNADANTGSARVGTIVGTLTATGQTSTFYVYQEGPGTDKYLNASFNKSTITAAANTLYLTISCPSGFAWNITSISTGLSLSQTSGTGPTELTVSVAANTGAQRTLSLLVKGTTYTSYQSSPSVTQEAPAATDYIRVTPFGDVTVNAETTSQTFSVVCSTSWQVTKAAGDSDVTISPASGSGNGTVVVTFPANTGSSTRAIPLSFSTTNGSGLSVNPTIRQKGAAQTYCEVDPDYVRVSKDAQSYNVTLSTSGAWTASKSVSWISVAASGSAGDNQTVAITVQENLTTSVRSGIVTFTADGKTASVTVSQGPGGTISVSQSVIAFGASADEFADIVVFSSDAWSVDDIPSWLSVTPSSGSGSANGEAVTIRTVGENLEGARSVTLYFAISQFVYAEVEISQALGSSLYCAPSDITVNHEAGDGYLQISSNTTWHVKSITGNVTVSPTAATSNTSVYYTYPANTGQTQALRTVVFETDDGTKLAMFSILQNPQGEIEY